MKAQETKDAELLGLSTVVNATRFVREATNAQRADRKVCLAYDDDVPWPELDALHKMLRERGVLEEE